MENKQPRRFLLYDLLIAPRYRVWRHVLLICALFLIGLNQSYQTYAHYELISVAHILLYALLIAVLYMAVIYCNLYILVPRFLYAKKYFRYLAGIVVCTWALVLLMDITEYSIFSVMELPLEDSFLFVYSEYSLLFDLIFVSSLMVVCVVGTTATSLLRQWETDSRNIHALKNDFLQSEIEELKERISPAFLFGILNKAGNISISDSENASSMLVKLSRILRYQLYDCSRETVLLTSEIAFVKNYLHLFHTYKDGFQYTIHEEGELKNIFVPPLLFLPLIQLMTGDSGVTKTEVKFIVSDDALNFICSVNSRNENMNETERMNINRHLKYVYNDSYRLLINESQAILHLNKL